MTLKSDYNPNTAKGKIKLLIPNIFTALSLGTALIALNFIMDGSYYTTAWLITLAIILDGCDGKIARLLGTTSRFGSLFDTIADFVAFGIVPAFLVFRFSLYRFNFAGAVISLIYVFCGAFRLIRYSLKHHEDSTKKPFTGLPIPAAAGLMSSMILTFHSHFSLPVHHFLLSPLMLFSSFLMISHWEYPPLEKDILKSKICKAILVIILIIIASAFKHLPLLYLLLISSYIIYGIVLRLITPAPNNEKSTRTSG